MCDVILSHHRLDSAILGSFVWDILIVILSSLRQDAKICRFLLGIREHCNGPGACVEATIRSLQQNFRDT